MDCSKCKGKLQIKRAYLKASNDTTSELKTEVANYQELACLNPQCGNYNIVVDTVKHLLELEE